MISSPRRIYGARLRRQCHYAARPLRAAEALDELPIDDIIAAPHFRHCFISRKPHNLRHINASRARHASVILLLPISPLMIDGPIRQTPGCDGAPRRQPSYSWLAPSTPPSATRERQSIYL